MSCLREVEDLEQELSHQRPSALPCSTKVGIRRRAPPAPGQAQRSAVLYFPAERRLARSRMRPRIPPAPVQPAPGLTPSVGLITSLLSLRFYLLLGSNTSGSPFFGFPMMTTFEFGLVANFSVASMPFHSSNCELIPCATIF
jgi:hypothetical protein